MKTQQGDNVPPINEAPQQEQTDSKKKPEPKPAKPPFGVNPGIMTIYG